MTEDEREVWKLRLEEAFRIDDETIRNRTLAKQADELWKIAPILIRWKNRSNCSDGCCEMDQLVMEEYASYRDAGLADLFQDNAIKPVRRIILDVEI